MIIAGGEYWTTTPRNHFDFVYAAPLGWADSLHQPLGRVLMMVLRKIASLSFMLPLAVPSALAAQSGLPQILYTRGPVYSQALSGELLARHNVERLSAGVPALQWDPALAQGAQAYANELARLNLLRHSPKRIRRGIGENLWMGTRDNFSPSRTVGDWASERSMFRPQYFPPSAGLALGPTWSLYPDYLARHAARRLRDRSARSDIMRVP